MNVRDVAVAVQWALYEAVCRAESIGVYRAVYSVVDRVSTIALALDEEVTDERE
jgi:hypothetical protein